MLCIQTCEYTSLLCFQAHGEKTAYAFMLDADFSVVDTWRLRHMAQRLVTECRTRSIVECMKGVKVSLAVSHICLACTFPHLSTTCACKEAHPHMAREGRQGQACSMRSPIPVQHVDVKIHILYVCTWLMVSDHLLGQDTFCLQATAPFCLLLPSSMPLLRTDGVKVVFILVVLALLEG